MRKVAILFDSTAVICEENIKKYDIGFVSLNVAINGENFRSMDLDENKFREDRKADAEKTVKMRMTIEEIIKRENLGATQDELKAKFSEYAEKSKKSVDEYMNTMSEQQYNYSYNEVTMNKLTAFLKEKNEFVEIEPKESKEECTHCK